MLGEVHLTATDFSGVSLWHIEGLPETPEPASVKVGDLNEETPLVDPTDEWRQLQQTIESLPPYGMRDLALEQLSSLNCESLKKKLASCDSEAMPSSDDTALRNLLKDASVGEAAYAKAVASVLKALVCSGGNDAVDVLRGISRGQYTRTRTVLPIGWPACRHRS